MQRIEDEKIMKKVLDLAKRGSPSPNPYVGAIIRKENKIIGIGYHKKAGEKHAEIEAIEDVKKRYKKKWKEKLFGSTLYVNLEPCNHYGRTPPCTKTIIESGIKRVVFATKDINKKVKGNGEKELKKHGIEVIKGILKKEAEELNMAYFKVEKTSLPFVIVKLACSLDGKIATKNFDSKWISSEKSRKIVQELRAKSDAILIGINTLKKDNPYLSVRKKILKKPIRVIVTTNLDKINGNEKIFFDNNVLIAYNKGSKKKIKDFEKRKITLVKCPEKNKKIDMKFFLEYLVKIGCNIVLVEGGGKIATDLLKRKLVDKLILFYCPKIIGGDGRNMFEELGIDKISKSYNVKFKNIKKIGPDLMIEIELKENKRLKDMAT